MNGFKIIEGTAAWIEEVATHDDMLQYNLESIQFTHMSLVYIEEGKVGDTKVAFFAALFRLHHR